MKAKDMKDLKLKIRILRLTVGVSRVYKPGEIIELPLYEAVQILKQELGETVEDECFLD